MVLPQKFNDSIQTKSPEYLGVSVVPLKKPQVNVSAIASANK